MYLKEIIDCDLRDVHALMCVQSFPGVPENYTEALPFFNEAQIYGLYEEAQLKAVFIFIESEEQSAYFDVLCAPEFHGRWANFATLKALYKLAFHEMDLRCLWVETHSSSALKAALSVGFVPVGNVDKDYALLALTPHQVNSRFKIVTKQEEKDYGITF